MSAQTALRIVVVGAGLGGLAAAIGLARSGHSVHIFEAAERLSEVGAGIQIPPNAARILDRWGLSDLIERQATVPTEENLRRFSNGELVGHQRRNTKDSFGYASMVIHRGDLQRILFDAAVQHGATVTFGRKLNVSKAYSSDMAEAVISAADVVVAADGIASNFRAGLVDHEEKYKPALTGDTASRLILPRKKLESDPKLRHLVGGPTNNVWMGPKRHVVAYTIKNVELYNVVLCGPGEAPVGTYNEPYDPDKLGAEYSDFEPTVRGIIAAADKAHRWTISEVPILPRWTDGKIVLLGDSAHAMMPYAAQGAAQCFEDAAVLTTCLSKLNSKQELADQLRLYEQIRRPRVERVQEVARGNRFLYGLEDGPEQRERDERLNQSLKGSSPAKPSLEKGQKRLEANSQAKYGSPEFSEWLYGVDVEREARTALV